MGAYKVSEKYIRILLVGLITVGTFHAGIVDQDINLVVSGLDLQPGLSDLVTRRDIHTKSKGFKMRVDNLEFYLDIHQFRCVRSNEYYGFDAGLDKGRCNASSPDATTGAGDNHRLSLERILCFGWMNGRINSGVGLSGKLA